MSPERNVAEIVAEFASKAQASFANSAFSDSWPEEQLKVPVADLLKSAGRNFGQNVTVTAESRVATLGVRPDLGVLVDHLIVGHVELKAPERPIDPKRFTGHDKGQWLKLRDHPNLIYTNGDQWRLYRSGDLVQQVQLSEDISANGVSAIKDGAAEKLWLMLRDFFTWKPTVPSNPRELAEVLAPLCRLLREAAVEAVQQEGSSLAQLAAEWRGTLFPDADDLQFADAYAQTVTYALLLARVEGETDLPAKAAKRLDARHGVLAQVLRLLTQEDARDEVDVPVSLLERTLSAIEPARWRVQSRFNFPASTDPASTARSAQAAALADPWLYFYEDFLADYDPQLRKNRGVYFTPSQVVSAQVHLVTHLLKTSFHKQLGIVDDDVVVLDPACGTGTYLIAAIAHGLSDVSQQYGGGDVEDRATTAAKNFHGFEILVGPYAVAHLRIAEQVLNARGELPGDGVHVYLTDTLDSPYVNPKGQQELALIHKKIAAEHERARTVKESTRVLVCMGNPPYHRKNDPSGSATDTGGGWVRFGDGTTPGILEDFLTPAREAGQGVHLKNLYNSYVYFWRWAIWKTLEQSEGPGIVSFITASSYLRGPGFIGMRSKMREVFDCLWIIDLGGEGRGARHEENVFAIQTPVAIAIGVRYGNPQPDTPATVKYAKITGTEAEKLTALASINEFDSLTFEHCSEEWDAPFLPKAAGVFTTWPLLADLFPWQHSGVQFKRTWPIAPDRKTLNRRWECLVAAEAAKRPALLHETAMRKVSSQVADLFSESGYLPAIKDLTAEDATQTKAIPYGYRSFDRQYALYDPRLCDRPRPAIHVAHGPEQVYMTSLLTGLLGAGPAATVTDLIPDLDHFRGSYGAKHVIPLWRDAGATEPNITTGVLDLLSTTYSDNVAPAALFAYAYAIFASPTYVEQFADNLEVPGPRLPLTRDAVLFRRAEALGRQLIFLHTFGQRCAESAGEAGRVPQGRARCLTAVSQGEYPEAYSYDEQMEVLKVGSGQFAPVSPEVYQFSVSGFPVVRSWLDYRMRENTGRRSSALDDIRPERWTFTEDLLRVLWVLEHTVTLFPDLARLLTDILRSRLFTADELPPPGEGEREGPTHVSTAQPQRSLW